jgi:hypothetical protein
MPTHKLLEFLTRKKKELEIVIDSKLPEDDTAVWIGEGTVEEYEEQQTADRGLRGVFGIGGGNNAP